MNVVAQLRCQGIGTKMIAAAETVVREQGHELIGIGVGITPDYGIAQKLYPKLGYVSDGSGVHENQWGGCHYSTKKLSQRLSLSNDQT